MLEPLFTAKWASPRLRSSPLGPWLDSFAGRLAGLGYTPWSCRSCVTLAADLGRWMADEGLLPNRLDESVIESYLNTRRTQRERRRAAAGLILHHLRAENVALPRQFPVDRSEVWACCQRYEIFLRKQRGAAEGTVEGYVTVIYEFLFKLFGDGCVDFTVLAAADIREYLLLRSEGLSKKRIAYLTTALRSFFRFLFAQSKTSTDLSTAILTVQMRHQASVPRYLAPSEVNQLLDTCDMKTPEGRRNKAILLLLVRLGLRAGEVARLELDDLRWRSGEIVIHGKGNIVSRLPLLAEVGAALSRYLADDRPQNISTRRVFVRLCAPVRELSGRGAVSTVVREGLKKAGLQPAGAHLLRHSLATRMIRAGASMGEIGEVLRHQNASTTSIYAKVDFDALRTVTQPWPNLGGAQ